MGLFFFETKEKAQPAMPGMQQTIRTYAEMFKCKVT